MNLQMNLKTYRAAYRLTQGELANTLGVSQQTVARWEKGTIPIKHQHVRVMCVLFECTADELLGLDTNDTEIGFEADDSEEGLNLFAEARDYESLFGFVRLITEGGVFEYPIGWNALAKYEVILDDYYGQHIRKNHDRPNWFHFWTLNNRGVFVNMDTVRKIEFVDDNEEAAPYAEHPEVWRSIAEEDVHPESSTLIAGRCDSVVEEYGAEEALEMATCLKLVYLDGSIESPLYENNEEISELVFRMELECLSKRITEMWKIGGGNRENLEYCNSKHILLWEYPLEMKARDMV